MEVDAPNASGNDRKINKVLEKLLQPNFKLKNDVYLNSLLTHLIAKKENFCENENSHISNQIFFEWILHATTHWEKRENLPAPQILSFATNLAAFISKDEQIFFKLNCNNVYERLIKIVSEPNSAPTVMLAYVNLLSSFLEHKSGLQWMIATNYWMDIMALTLKGQTVYISKEGYKFMAKLLERTIKLNENFCINVIQLITDPLSENLPCLTNGQAECQNPLEIRHQELHQRLCSTLTLITEILEILMENIKSTTDYVSVLLIFVNKFNLEKRIHTILLVAQEEEFIYALSRILFMLAFFEVLTKFGGSKVITYEQSLPHCDKIFQIFLSQMTKGYVRNVLRLCYVGHIYWSNIASKMPICLLREEPLKFENQLMMFQLVPIVNISERLLGKSKVRKSVDCDEFRDLYITKLLKISGSKTIQTGYKWRNFLLPQSLIFDHATLSLMYLLKSKEFFRRDAGAIVFQSLIYCLKDIVDHLKENPVNVQLLTTECNFTEKLLDAIAVYIQEFNLSWKDSIETICVMNCAFDFLSFPTWIPKLVVKGLKLIDIAISKYMTPNMALLIDTTKDSTLALIGPLLYAKLHDSSWEVRDSALEVICNISYNANTRFPSFQKIVLDAELPHLIVKMAIQDGESFVRSTALKCLQEMIQVQDFWDNLLQNNELYNQIIEILAKETEGIVRREAATLMCRIFEHQHFPDRILGKVYDIMAHAATTDLHWEVKVNALSFWEKVINVHLQHQGMIDGTFPNVTFSKEHRKIVTLNENEVKKRLIKVLNQLSETGCLAVLVTAIQDDCDVEVSKTATKITKNFVGLLKTYNIDALNSNLSQPPSPLTPFNFAATSPSYQDSQYNSMSPSSHISQNSPVCAQSSPMTSDFTDDILDGIINSQDVNLLTGVYNPTDQVCDFMPIRSKQILGASDFIKFTFNDLESYMNGKRRWLNNMDDFGSLLDDILKEYNENDINSMDCY